MLRPYQQGCGTDAIWYLQECGDSKWEFLIEIPEHIA